MDYPPPKPPIAIVEKQKTGGELTNSMMEVRKKLSSLTKEDELSNALSSLTKEYELSNALSSLTKEYERSSLTIFPDTLIASIGDKNIYLEELSGTIRCEILKGSTLNWHPKGSTWHLKDSIPFVQKLSENTQKESGREEYLEIDQCEFLKGSTPNWSNIFAQEEYLEIDVSTYWHDISLEEEKVSDFVQVFRLVEELIQKEIKIEEVLGKVLGNIENEGPIPNGVGELWVIFSNSEYFKLITIIGLLSWFISKLISKKIKINSKVDGDYEVEIEIYGYMSPEDLSKILTNHLKTIFEKISEIQSAKKTEFADVLFRNNSNTVTASSNDTFYIQDEKNISDEEITSNYESAVIPLNKKVFVVHGHDELAKTSLEAFLREKGLEPVILQRQADQGSTIIEKLERHSDVGYAFILLTPDETIYLEEQSKPDAERKKEFRARLDVIFEFGYFVGKLGRKQVCCLYTGNVSLPSDVAGMIYKKYDKRIEEIETRRRLKISTTK